MYYQTQKDFWNFFRIPSFRHYPYSLPLYFPFFYHLPKIIILLSPMKFVGTNIPKIWNWKSHLEESRKWSRFALFKRRRWKEVEEDPNSVANGRFYCLVALRRFHWLVGNGKKRSNTFLLLFTFPPTNFT